MKRIIALLAACALLLAAVPALAEEATLHTFAGIPWDTLKSEFIAVATEKSGVPFDDYPADVYRESNPTFVAQNGYYSVFGLPLDAQQGLHAHYAQTEAYLRGEVEWTAPAAWTFDRFSCVSAEQPLAFDVSSLKALKNDLTMYENDLRLAQDVADNISERYGTPDKAYVALSDWGYEYYLVAEEELPWVIADAVLFAAMNDVSAFKVVLVWNNVLWTLEADMPVYQNGIHNDGSYTISIDYLNHPVASGDFSDVYYGDVYAADYAEPFPLLNGEIPYIVIEP